MLQKYIYKGPVKQFDVVINPNWIGTTIAVSESKARSNLTYQYKRQSNRTSDSNIVLTGKIKKIGD